MNYLEFHDRWHAFGCFSIQQIYAWRPGFNRLNITQWVKKGYMVKLRKEWYAFKEFLKVPDSPQYVANRIYRPSYISLHTALSHYGMIPEAVMAITSVSSLKTMKIENDFGIYTYQSVKPELMFGYEPKLMADGRAIFFATPEKALIDLLYLYPFYKTEEDMIDLRLDDDFMQEDFDKDKFLSYAAEIKSQALDRRIETLLTTYAL